MAAKTFWQWYDKELPSGDDALNFQAAWDAAIESVEENGNSNSLQQLKAEISAMISKWKHCCELGDAWYEVESSDYERLQKLSAV